MKLTVTRVHTGKMEGMKSLNTHTINNPFCQRKVKSNVICAHCYVGEVVARHPENDFHTWINNGIILSTRLLEDNEVPKFRNKEIMRFHSFGELFNEIHLRNFIAIACKNPQIIFTLWSKRANIVKKCKNDISDNLVMIYSTPTINGVPKIPAGFHKVFTVFTAKHAMKNGVDINCQGKCIECRICYNRSTTRLVNEVLKSEAHLYHQ